MEPIGDDLGERLTSALILSGVVSNVGATNTIDASDLWTKPGRTGAFNVLDTSKLDLNQRVLMQLHGVGLVNCSSSTYQVSDCNVSSLGMRNAGTSLIVAQLFSCRLKER